MFDLDSLTMNASQVAKFKIGDEVIDPVSGLTGSVVRVEKPEYDWMGYQYQVVLSNGTPSMFEEDRLQHSFNTSDVFELCANRSFASYGDYMIVNTLFKIDNVNNNTISTLRASRTQFKAYQFKPLLKFFASPEKRILIADEVGLGKTIEAGHILLELKARKEFRNAVIVCPKSLREKWRTEMQQRFGLDFTIYGGEDNEGIKYPSMADLFAAYKSGRDVHAIINYERIRYREQSHGKDEVVEHRANSLIEFIIQEKVQNSVVICDESHRLRNMSTLSYHGAEKLLESSDAVIFLTATPVMISEDNLYNQMHLLCPEKYSDVQIFSNRMSLSRPFVYALNELCAGSELMGIWHRLHERTVERIIKTETKFGPIAHREKLTVDECFSDDPIYQRIKSLFCSGSTAVKTRAELQMHLMSMSAIQNEFTRTTKRSVRNELSKVNERFPYTVKITLTPDEQKMFDKVINDYDEQTGGSNLGTVQIKRMVSSSVYGYCNSHDDLENGIDVFEDKPDSKIEALTKKILRPSDSNQMRVIKKVVVFAVFVDTLKYLKIRLEKQGVKCALLDGSIEDRQSVIDRFKADDDVQVLLSSEVGSEGLDMQFCDTIVNYDLPWNPMVVEQRIGRIDRIGQTAESIFIYNFVVKGSITEDIYERLAHRIEIFKGTIGDLEPILTAPYKDGQSILEAHNNLEIRYYRGEISREQILREEEQIKQAIESQRMTLERLNDEMGKNTISMDSYYDEQINLIRKRKAYVTEVELQNLLKKVLGAKESGCCQCVLELSQEDGRVWKLRIPQNLADRDCLVRFLSKYRPAVSDSLRAYDEFVGQVRGRHELTVTFNQVVANENRQIVFVNNYSPLVLACNEFRAKVGIATKKVFMFELRCDGEPTGILRAGDRFFLLNYQLTISGVSKANSRPVKELYPILFDIDREEIIEDENVVSCVCCLAQDQGRETQMPSLAECSREKVAKFKALATRAISRIVSDKKKDIDERNNAERIRWLNEFNEFYESKIDYYQGELTKCEKSENGAWLLGTEERIRLKNEISGYRGTITRLKRERDEKLPLLGDESDVSITREEVSACYVAVR